MSEEKQVKKQLVKNMFLNLITFIIIFTVLGTIIYGQFRSSLYKSADEELKRSVQMKEFDGPGPARPNEQEMGVRMDNIKELNSPRLITIKRYDDDDNNEMLENSQSITDRINDFAKDVDFDENILNTIYETENDGYHFRGINYKNDDGTYSQVLINIDSERDIAKNFITNLIISFSIAIIVILIASYILSTKTLKPIIESWKKQTRFVQDASHELRTPLAIIKAKQESLLEKPESKIIDNAEDISITLNETQRLTKLIKELMELAKNDSDKITLNKESFNIDKELEQLINLYKLQAETDKKNLQLNLNYDEYIYADINKLKELLIILLDNSLKYTNQGDTIEVKTYKENNRFILEVIDSGIGISPEAIDHVFERFYREEASRSREKGGMGLGLSIAYNIVQLHKGSIKFDKYIKKGTRVIVKLPIK